MHYKLIFHAVIDDKKQTLDTVIESGTELELTDRVVAKAGMKELADVIEPGTKEFTVKFHLDILLPLD